MILWLDAQLPPAAAAWITATFAIETHAVRDLGLRNAKDASIFQAARAAEAVVMTKDGDFVDLPFARLRTEIWTNFFVYTPYRFARRCSPGHQGLSLGKTGLQTG